MPVVRPFLRYSPFDAIPAACGVGIVALLTGSLEKFDVLSWWGWSLEYFAESN